MSVCFCLVCVYRCLSGKPAATEEEQRILAVVCLVRRWKRFFAPHSVECVCVCDKHKRNETILSSARLSWWRDILILIALSMHIAHCAMVEVAANNVLCDVGDRNISTSTLCSTSEIYLFNEKRRDPQNCLPKHTNAHTKAFLVSMRFKQFLFL